MRQRLGTGEENIELPNNVRTVRALADALRQRGGAYADVFSEGPTLKAAVNQAHMGWDAAVSADDEVAFFPPVTGG